MPKRKHRRSGTSPHDEEDSTSNNKTTTDDDDDSTSRIVGSRWSCQVCTLENPTSRRRCEACQARKPVFDIVKNRTSNASNNKNNNVGTTTTTVDDTEVIDHDRLGSITMSISNNNGSNSNNHSSIRKKRSLVDTWLTRRRRRRKQQQPPQLDEESFSSSSSSILPSVQPFRVRLFLQEREIDAKEQSGEPFLLCACLEDKEEQIQQQNVPLLHATIPCVRVRVFLEGREIIMNNDDTPLYTQLYQNPNVSSSSSSLQATGTVGGGNTRFGKTIIQDGINHDINHHDENRIALLRNAACHGMQEPCLLPSPKTDTTYTATSSNGLSIDPIPPSLTHQTTSATTTTTSRSTTTEQSTQALNVLDMADTDPSTTLTNTAAARQTTTLSIPVNNTQNIATKKSIQRVQETKRIQNDSSCRQGSIGHDATTKPPSLGTPSLEACPDFRSTVDPANVETFVLYRHHHGSSETTPTNDFRDDPQPVKNSTTPLSLVEDVAQGEQEMRCFSLPSSGLVEIRCEPRCEPRPSIPIDDQPSQPNNPLLMSSTRKSTLDYLPQTQKSRPVRPSHINRTVGSDDGKNLDHDDVVDKRPNTLKSTDSDQGGNKELQLKSSAPKPSPPPLQVSEDFDKKDARANETTPLVVNSQGAVSRLNNGSIYTPDPMTSPQTPLRTSDSQSHMEEKEDIGSFVGKNKEAEFTQTTPCTVSRDFTCPTTTCSWRPGTQQSSSHNPFSYTQATQPSQESQTTLPSSQQLMQQGSHCPNPGPSTNILKHLDSSSPQTLPDAASRDVIPFKATTSPTPSGTRSEGSNATGNATLGDKEERNGKASRSRQVLFQTFGLRENVSKEQLSRAGGPLLLDDSSKAGCGASTSLPPIASFQRAGSGRTLRVTEEALSKASTLLQIPSESQHTSAENEPVHLAKKMPSTKRPQPPDVPRIETGKTKSSDLSGRCFHGIGNRLRGDDMVPSPVDLFQGSNVDEPRSSMPNFTIAGSGRALQISAEALSKANILLNQQDVENQRLSSTSNQEFPPRSRPQYCSGRKKLTKPSSRQAVKNSVQRQSTSASLAFLRPERHQDTSESNSSRSPERHAVAQTVENSAFAHAVEASEKSGRPQLPTFQTAGSRAPLEVSEEQLSRAEDLLEGSRIEETYSIATLPIVSFHSAGSGKVFRMSEEKLSKASNLLDLPEDSQQNRSSNSKAPRQTAKRPQSHGTDHLLSTTREVPGKYTTKVDKESETKSDTNCLSGAGPDCGNKSPLRQRNDLFSKPSASLPAPATFHIARSRGFLAASKEQQSTAEARDECTNDDPSRPELSLVSFKSAGSGKAIRVSEEELCKAGSLLQLRDEYQEETRQPTTTIPQKNTTTQQLSSTRYLSSRAHQLPMQTKQDNNESDSRSEKMDVASLNLDDRAASSIQNAMAVVPKDLVQGPIGGKRDGLCPPLTNVPVFKIAGSGKALEVSMEDLSRASSLLNRRDEDDRKQSQPVLRHAENQPSVISSDRTKTALSNGVPQKSMGCREDVGAAFAAFQTAGSKRLLSVSSEQLAEAELVLLRPTDEESRIARPAIEASEKCSRVNSNCCKEGSPGWTQQPQALSQTASNSSSQNFLQDTKTEEDFQLPIFRPDLTPSRVRGEKLDTGTHVSVREKTQRAPRVSFCNTDSKLQMSSSGSDSYGSSAETRPLRSPNCWPHSIRAVSSPTPPNTVAQRTPDLSLYRESQSRDTNCKVGDLPYSSPTPHLSSVHQDMTPSTLKKHARSQSKPTALSKHFSFPDADETTPASNYNRVSFAPSDIPSMPRQQEAAQFETPCAKKLNNGHLLEAAIKRGEMAHAEECKIYDVHHSLVSVNSSNAELIRFDRSTGSPADILGGDKVQSSDLIGSSADFRLSLQKAGCDGDQISLRWLRNHCRWINWKLASIERRFPRFLANRFFTYSRVVEHLRSRYRKEIEEGKRSALRKVLNQDVSSKQMLLLCIAQVFCSQCKEQSSSMDSPVSYCLELTDGWYSILAKPDEFLSSRIEEGLLCEGTKLVISQAELCGGDEALDPLDEKYRISPTGDCPYLRLSSNGTRISHWRAKLGFVAANFNKNEPLCLRVRRLNDIVLGGGNVPMIDFCLLKSHPLQYLTQGDDAPRTVLSEKAEEERRLRFDKQQSNFVEKMALEIETECSKVCSPPVG